MKTLPIELILMILKYDTRLLLLNKEVTEKYMELWIKQIKNNTKLPFYEEITYYNYYEWIKYLYIDTEAIEVMAKWCWFPFKKLIHCCSVDITFHGTLEDEYDSETSRVIPLETADKLLAATLKKIKKDIPWIKSVTCRQTDIDVLSIFEYSSLESLTLDSAPINMSLINTMKNLWKLNIGAIVDLIEEINDVFPKIKYFEAGEHIEQYDDIDPENLIRTIFKMFPNLVVFKCNGEFNDLLDMIPTSLKELHVKYYDLCTFGSLSNELDVFCCSIAFLSESANIYDNTWLKSFKHVLGNSRQWLVGFGSPAYFIMSNIPNVEFDKYLYCLESLDGTKISKSTYTNKQYDSIYYYVDKSGDVIKLQQNIRLEKLNSIVLDIAESFSDDHIVNWIKQYILPYGWDRNWHATRRVT